MELDTGEFASHLCVVTTRKDTTVPCWNAHHCSLLMLPLGLLGCCQVCKLTCKMKRECFSVPGAIPVMLRFPSIQGTKSNLKGRKRQQQQRGHWAGCRCFPLAADKVLGWAAWGSLRCCRPWCPSLHTNRTAQSPATSKVTAAPQQEAKCSYRKRCRRLCRGKKSSGIFHEL